MRVRPWRGFASRFESMTLGTMTSVGVLGVFVEVAVGVFATGTWVSCGISGVGNGWARLELAAAVWWLVSLAVSNPIGLPRASTSRT